METYPCFDAYALSFLIEPFVPRIVAEDHVGAADDGVTVQLKGQAPAVLAALRAADA
jgi:hypothetical protein